MGKNQQEIRKRWNARVGKSKLKRFRDGFNHLKFLVKNV